MDKMRDGIRHFLKIQDDPKQTFSIRELLDHDGNCVKNIIWYRGESYELTQFYQNIPGGADGVKFWAAKSTVGREIRKIHTGLPGIIVDRLTDIVINDFSQISFNKESDKRAVSYTHLSKEEQARREGMAYALRLAKEKGIDALEEDLKMRNAIDLPLRVSKADLDKFSDNVKYLSLIHI